MLSETLPDMDKKVVFSCGASSSEEMLRFDQIPACAIRRGANRFTLGGRKYDPPTGKYLGGEMNWQQGDAEFFRDRFNHLIEHALRWKEEYERGVEHAEDHLAAIWWAASILMWAEENGRLSPKR